MWPHESKNAEADHKHLQAWMVAFTRSMIDPHLMEVPREASRLVGDVLHYWCCL